MLAPEESRKLGWVPYVMDFSADENMRFVAAVANANDFNDLPQWVRDAAEAADRKVGVQTWLAPGARRSTTRVAGVSASEAESATPVMITEVSADPRQPGRLKR
jgi:hypothetical protein